MPRPSEGELITLGPWPRGVNNVAREDSVTPQAVREAVNIDFMPDGKIRRRSGTTLVQAGASDNFWSNGSYALYTAGNQLMHFAPGESPAVVYTGIQQEASMCYASVNHLIYASDGHTALRVDPMLDSARPWGVPVPGTPQLSLNSTGGLNAGKYMVAVTFVATDNEESGATVVAEIEVPEGGGIDVAVPGPGVSYVSKANIYVNAPGGSQMFLHGSVTGPAYQITRQPLGRELQTMGLEPMPAGHLAALAGGFFLVAVKNVVLWSPALRYGAVNLETSYLSFAGEVDLLAPSSSGATMTGVFAAAGERIYFLGGNDPAKFTNQVAFGRGVVRGSLQYIDGAFFEIEGFPSQPLPVWYTTSGIFCVGLPDGTVYPLTEGRFSGMKATGAFAALRSNQGVRQMLVGLKGQVSGSNIACTDVAEAVLIKAGASRC